MANVPTRSLWITFLLVCVLLLTASRVSAFTALSSYQPTGSRTTPANVPYSTTATAALAAAAAVGPRTQEPATVTLFQTDPIPVYIEDTDAYGVIYNGNYVRVYDRALFLHHQHQQQQASTDTTDTLDNNNEKAWSMVGLKEQKFKASPALGDSYIVTGSLQDAPAGSSNCNDEQEVWDMSMTSPCGTTVYHTAKGVRLVRSRVSNDDNANTVLNGNGDSSSALPPVMSTTTPSCQFVLHRDEFDFQSRNLALRSVLNLMERSRSNLLGGPDQLLKLQQAGILFVVVSIDNLKLYDGTAAPAPRDESKQQVLMPGQVVSVQTVHTVKRRGMVVECHQRLFRQDSNNNGIHAVAESVVTLMALNAETRRPTNKLPAAVLQTLGVKLQE